MYDCAELPLGSRLRPLVVESSNEYSSSEYSSTRVLQVAVNMLKNLIYEYNIYLGLLLRVCVSTPRVVHLVPPETTF
jgi:hypothetical protein